MIEIDPIDMEILTLLRKNARMQWRDIGKHVFLTGQAVANRIKRLEELGVIQAFTLQINEALLGKPLLALVTVFMKSANHGAFRRWVQAEPAVKEAYRVSGDGCYSLKLVTSGHEELNGFLDRLLEYGNYRVLLSIGTIK